MTNFSFFSWNIRHFKSTAARLKEVNQFITQLNPDVYSLIEYQGKSSIRELLVDRFPEYDFAVTDSMGNLELVIAMRRGKFDQVVWTQKRTFNDRARKLRPGALISLRLGNEFYNLLYLYTGSGTTSTDYSNRQKVFKKIWKLEKALANRASSGKANLIVLGDLNILGKGRTISGESEINRLSRAADRNGIRILSKDADTTWGQWGKGSRGNRRKLRVSELDDLLTSNLDCVIASNNLDFVPVGVNREDIAVKVWKQLSASDKANFLWNILDQSKIITNLISY